MLRIIRWSVSMCVTLAQVSLSHDQWSVIIITILFVIRLSSSTHVLLVHQVSRSESTLYIFMNCIFGARMLQHLLHFLVVRSHHDHGPCQTSPIIFYTLHNTVVQQQSLIVKISQKRQCWSHLWPNGQLDVCVQLTKNLIFLEISRNFDFLAWIINILWTKLNQTLWWWQASSAAD